MIHGYFQQRSHLASAHSSFHCDPLCSRPGCASLEMQVPVTIFDLMGAAIHRGQSIGEVHDRSYAVGVLPREGFDWIKSVSLKLRKPCPFLENQRCTIYEVRPLPCILFPEYQAVNGTIRNLAARTEYLDYVCLRSPFGVSRERARAVRLLAGMLEREVIVSDFYLFGMSPFWVDFSSLTADMAQEADEQRPHGSRDESEADPVIPFEAFDRIFTKTFLQCSPLAGLDDRIRDLRRQDLRASMLHDLNDSKILRRLRRQNEDPSLVFQYVDGALVARRQSFTLREHMFL